MAREGEEVAMDGDPENSRSSFALFRRQDKYHIGEDFDLFVKKLCYTSKRCGNGYEKAQTCPSIEPQ